MTITRLNPRTIQLVITKDDWLSGYRSRAARLANSTYDTCQHCAVARAAQKNGYGEVRVGALQSGRGGTLFTGNPLLPVPLTRLSTRLERLYEQFDEATNTAALPEPATLNLTLTRAGREYFNRG